MISRIGKYTVEAELGRGGFGRVYRAWDPDVQRRVAIKVLTAESDPELLRRFQMEVGTTGNLAHKNIVTVYECGEQSGAPYLVMELLEGETLEQIIKRRAPLSLLERVRIMAQVADGLNYAHSRHVIHRDVKPSNIMLLADGSVKIMDFGIARVTTKHSMQLTREGFVIGTVPYMAPEQFEPGGRADEQTDIFGYGDIYYELLTGNHPFAVESDIYATIARIKTFEPEALSRAVPGCPEALELLVHRAIAKDREIRYQSFAELLLDSEAILVDLKHERATVLLAEVAPLVEAGELESAEKKLLEIAELEPGNHEARQYRKTIADEKQRRAVARRVSVLIEESETFGASRRFGEAVQALETAARLDKNNSEIQARLSEARQRLQAHLKANKLVAEARRDQQKGELAEAVARIKAALEADAGHTDAQALLPRLEAELGRRERERLTQQSLREISELIAQRMFAAASAKLDEFEAAQPGSSRAMELRGLLERERAEQQRRERADQFNALAAELRGALQHRDWGKCEDILSTLSHDYADVPGASELALQSRAQLEAQVRAEAISAYGQQARDLIRQKWLPEALNLLDQALERFPNESGLLRLRESAEALYAAQRHSEAVSSLIAEAAALRDAGNLEQALNLIERGRGTLGDEPAFHEIERELEIELEHQRYAAGLDRLLANAQNLFEAGKYEETIGLLEAAEVYQAEAEVQALLDSARSAAALERERRAVEAALEAARKLEQDRQLQPALDLVRDTLREYPHNLALAQTEERLTKRLAEEHRNRRVDELRAQVSISIAQRNWARARAEIERAQAELPNEFALAEIAEQVTRAEFDATLADTVEDVRNNLANNDIARAEQLLTVTRAVYSGDPRWQSLEHQVAKRKAYEAALAAAVESRHAGDLAAAETRLTQLVHSGALDDRATRLLSEVKEEKFAREAGRIDEAMDAGDFDRAIAIAEALTPDAPEGWKARLANRCAEAKRRRQAAIEREERERETAESSKIFETIRQLLSGGEVERAQAELKKGRVLYPKADLWPRAEQEIEDHRRFLQLIDRDPARAVHELTEALHRRPDRDTLGPLLEKARISLRESLCREAVQEAEQLARAGRLADADRRLDEADDPAVEEARKRIRALRAEADERRAAEAIRAADEIRLRSPERALAFLLKHCAEAPSSAALEAAIERCRQEIRQRELTNAIAEIDRLRQAQKYSKALEAVSRARSRLGADEAFAELQARIEAEQREQRPAEKPRPRSIPTGVWAATAAAGAVVLGAALWMSLPKPSTKTPSSAVANKTLPAPRQSATIPPPAQTAPLEPDHPLEAPQPQRETAVIIETREPGAAVTIDGIRAGWTGKNGAVASRLAPGRHVISVAKNGFDTVTERIDVRAGVENLIRVTMRPQTAAEAAASNIPLTAVRPPDAPVNAGQESAPAKGAASAPAPNGAVSTRNPSARVDSAPSDRPPLPNISQNLPTLGVSPPVQPPSSYPQPPAISDNNAADIQAVWNVVARFAASFSEKNFADVENLWPDMPNSRSYRDLFRDREYSVRFTLEPVSAPRVEGDRAQITARRTVETLYRKKPSVSGPVSVVISLRKIGGRWIILSMQ
jgi:hypothetical protein